MTRAFLKTSSSLLALIGVADSAYLAAEHFAGKIPPCSVLRGCESVLTSQYAEVAGVPLALIGLVYYLTLLILSRLEGRRALFAMATLTSLGLAISAGLVYLQVAVIGAICLFCMTSAGTTTLLWIVSLLRINHKR